MLISTNLVSAQHNDVLNHELNTTLVYNIADATPHAASLAQPRANATT